jgi:D-beta-D-heptose 7-phosphate kinase/D-beta-D-heptose 1-phosphate adenosyltransferase
MLVSREEIVKMCGLFRKDNKKIVFTNGCFDILHAGHVTYLKQAKALGDLLVIGLNSDSSVNKLKGQGRPVVAENDRALVLSALRSVDFVVFFDEETPYELINSIKPDFLVKGGDYTPDSIVGADIVKDAGGEVVVIPFVEGKSTTGILDRIRNL